MLKADYKNNSMWREIVREKLDELIFFTSKLNVIGKSIHCTCSLYIVKSIIIHCTLYNNNILCIS